jgi:hypothetical protein
MAKFEVCPRCEGEGKHMNPSIGEVAYTREDFDADPDFEEQYFSGAYDVTCYECKGQRVVKAREAKTQDELEQEEWEREWAAEQRMESLMLGEY